jgi:hypothetical protein
MKIPVLFLLAWTARQSQAREVFQIAPLARTQTERRHAERLNCLNGATRLDPSAEFILSESRRAQARLIERFERSEAIERIAIVIENRGASIRDHKFREG